MSWSPSRICSGALTVGPIHARSEKLASVVKQYLNSPAYRATQEADSRTALAAARDFEPDLVVTPNVAVHKIGIVVGIVPITVQRTRDAMNWHPTPGFICGARPRHAAPRLRTTLKGRDHHRSHLASVTRSPMVGRGTLSPARAAARVSCGPKRYC